MQDNCGNSYLPENKIYLTYNKIGNSNDILNKNILEKVIFLYIKVREDNWEGVIIDDFRSYSIDIVKDYSKSFKSSNHTKNEED